MPRPWLPSVTQAKSLPTVSFYSDHFLQITETRVTLRAKPSPAHQALENLQFKFTAEDKEEQLQNYNDALTQILATGQTSNAKQNNDTHHHIYTDGSGPGNNANKHSIAGWGFTTMEGQTHWGRVHTFISSTFYLGATVASHNAAELSALIEAMTVGLWSSRLWRPSQFPC